MADTEINIENLQQAFKLAMSEAQEANKAFEIAESNSRRVNAIPKGRAGSGKGAKNEAANDLRKARQLKVEKSHLLEVAEKSLADALGRKSESANTEGKERVLMGDNAKEDNAKEKRGRDELSDGTMDSNKKQRVTQSGGEIQAASAEEGEARPPSQTNAAIDASSSPSHSNSAINTQAQSNAASMDTQSNASMDTHSDAKINTHSNAIDNQYTAAIVTSSDNSSHLDADAEMDTSSSRNLRSFTDLDKSEDEEVENVLVDLDKFQEEDSEKGDAAVLQVEKMDDKDSQKEDPIDPNRMDDKPEVEEKSKRSRDLLPRCESDSGISEFSDSDSENDDSDLPIYASDTDEDGPSDEDRRSYAEKNTKNPDLKSEDKKLYRFLDENGRKEWNRKGLEAINRFLQERKDIDSTIRRMARVDPTYLPEAANTSRRLAIHFLTSKDGNVQCGYHAFKNKSTFVRDGWGKKGAQIRGVPGKKKMSDMKKRTGSVKPAAKGLGNCGCRINDILLEFCLSKRLKITGMVDGSRMEEMMLGTQDYLEPRDRSFSFEAIRSMTPAFSVNDFFKHGLSEATKDMKIARKQARYCLNVLNIKYKNHAMDPDRPKELVVLSKFRMFELGLKEKTLGEMDQIIQEGLKDTESSNDMET